MLGAPFAIMLWLDTNIPIVFATRYALAVRHRLRSYASTPSALQTHAEDLRRILHEMHPGPYGANIAYQKDSLIYNRKNRIKLKRNPLMWATSLGLPVMYKG